MEEAEVNVALEEATRRDAEKPNPPAEDAAKKAALEEATKRAAEEKAHRVAELNEAKVNAALEEAARREAEQQNEVCIWC